MRFKLRRVGVLNMDDRKGLAGVRGLSSSLSDDFENSESLPTWVGRDRSFRVFDSE